MSWKRDLLSRSSDILVSASSNSISFWSLQPFRLADKVENVETKIWSILELENKFSTGSSTGTINIWSLEKLEVVGKIEAHSNAIFSLGRLSENRIASCSLDRSIRIWSLTDLKEENVKSCASVSLKGHQNCVRSIVTTPQNYLVSGSWDKDVRIWDVTQEACVQVYKKHFDKVNCVEYLNHQNWIFSGGDDKRCHIWCFRTHKLVQTLKTRAGITSLAIQTSNKILVGEQSGKINIFDIRNMKQPNKTISKAHSGPILQLCPCTSTVFSSCSNDLYIRLWNSKSGGKVREFGDNGDVHAMMKLRKTSSSSAAKTRRLTPRRKRKKKYSLLSQRRRIPKSDPVKRNMRYNLKSEVNEKGGVVFRSPLFSPPMNPSVEEEDSSGEKARVGVKVVIESKKKNPNNQYCSPNKRSKGRMKLERKLRSVTVKSSKMKKSNTPQKNDVLFENSFLGDIQQKLKKEISLRKEELENIERLNEENTALRKTGKSLRERLRRKQNILQTRNEEVKNGKEELEKERKRCISLEKRIRDLENLGKEKIDTVLNLEKEKKGHLKKIEEFEKQIGSKMKETNIVKKKFRKIELLRNEEEQEKEDWKVKYYEIQEKLENFNQHLHELQSRKQFLTRKLENQERKNEQLFNQFQTHLKKSRHKILTAKANIEELQRATQREKKKVRMLEKRNETLFLKLKNVLSTLSNSLNDGSSWEGQASQKLMGDLELKLDQKSRQIEAIRQQLGWLKKEQTTNARLLSRNKMEIQYIQLRKQLMNRRTDLLPSSSSSGVVSSSSDNPDFTKPQQQKNTEKRLTKMLEEKRGIQVDLERRAIPIEELDRLEQELQSSLKSLTQIRGSLQVCDPDSIFTCVHTQYILPALVPFVSLASVKYVRWKERLEVYECINKLSRRTERNSGVSSTPSSSIFPFIQIYGNLEKKSIKTVYYLVESCPVKLFDYFRTLDESSKRKSYDLQSSTSRGMEDVDRTKLQLLRQAAVAITKLHDEFLLAHLDLQPKNFRVVKDDRNLPRVKMGGYRYIKKVRSSMSSKSKSSINSKETSRSSPKLGRRNEKYLDVNILEYLSNSGKMNQQVRDPWMKERDVYSFGVIMFHAIFLLGKRDLSSSSSQLQMTNEEDERKDMKVSSSSEIRMMMKEIEEEQPFDKFRERMLKEQQQQSQQEFSLLTSLRNYFSLKNDEMRRKSGGSEEPKNEDEDVNDGDGKVGKGAKEEEKENEVGISVKAIKKIGAFQVLVEDEVDVDSISSWERKLLKLIQNCMLGDERKRPAMNDVVHELVEIEKLQMKIVSEREEEERRRRSMGEDDLSMILHQRSPSDENEENDSSVVKLRTSEIGSSNSQNTSDEVKSQEEEFSADNEEEEDLQSEEEDDYGTSSEGEEEEEEEGEEEGVEAGNKEIREVSLLAKEKSGEPVVFETKFEEVSSGTDIE